MGFSVTKRVPATVEIEVAAKIVWRTDEEGHGVLVYSVGAALQGVWHYQAGDCPKVAAKGVADSILAGLEGRPTGIYVSRFSLIQNILHGALWQIREAHEEATAELENALREATAELEDALREVAQ
jgi:hypothetical protein